MSGDPTFADDATAYANLALEINSGPDDPLDEIMGGTIDQPPLDESAVQQGYAQQNAQHQAAVQQPQEDRSAERLGFPDPDEDPVGYMKGMFNAMGHALATSEAGRDFWNHVDRSEREAREQFGGEEYDLAVQHLESARRQQLEQMYPDAVLRQHGYQNPAEVRLALLNRDRIAVSQRAIQMGVPPAKLYYDLAIQNGYKSNRGPTRDEFRQLQRLGGRDWDETDQRLWDNGRNLDEQFDQAWDAMARKGLL